MPAARRTKKSSARTAPARATPHKRPARSKGRKQQARDWLPRLLALGAFLLTLGALTAAAGYWYYSRDLPDADAVRDYAPPQTTHITDRQGRLIGEFFRERRTVVPMERIPRVLVLSVLAAEDADFYHHSGMDVPGILRILGKFLWTGRASQGASTITQQVVKNLLLTPERTVRRKVRELILARRIEEDLSKDEILFLYLNHINFGHGRYGVQEASRFYFDKDVEELNLQEASLLAGMPQAPTRLSPRTHPKAARRRQLFVLGQLEEKREQYWDDLPLAEIQAAREAGLPELAPRESMTARAPEVAMIARQVLIEAVGEERAREGGYTVETTIDLELQKKAREAVQQGLRAVDERQGRRAPLKRPRVSERTLQAARAAVERADRAGDVREGGTYDAVVLGADDEAGTLKLAVKGREALADVDAHDRFNPKQLPPSRFAEPGVKLRATVLRAPEEGPLEVELALGPEGAAVVIDPRSREVRALVGSYAAEVGFNRATQAARQPGSTFKPIVYALGIRSRQFTPASMVIDAPGVFDKYKPGNYETWAHEGPVRLRHGLAHSINLVAIRVIDELGPPAVAEFGHQLGLSTDLEASLPLALGASAVHPIELTNAYATFAAGGRWAPYRIVRAIRDRDGNPVPLPEQPAARDVMTPAEAYVITDMLTSVVEEGTGARARALGRPAAGKTGTSNQARDAWFMGYTPGVVAGVWVGFDDNRPLGRKETGGRTALPIWVDLMQAATADRPKQDFAMPGGVETAHIDPATGLLSYDGQPDAIEEVFLDGTAPTDVARPPDVVDPATFVMEQLGGFDSPQPAE